MNENLYYHLTGLFSNKLRSNLKKFFFNYFASNELDIKLEKYLNYDRGYFVELGANDGINQSNTFYFEKKRRWSGVLIEPFKINYLECKKNRSKKNKFFCTACVANNKIKKLKLLYANLMTTSTHNKKNLEKIKKYKIHGDKRSSKKYFYAEAKTLNEILNLAKSPKIIDLLSLDVEGSELNVLKGINYKSYLFKYMLIECNDYNKIVNFLKTKNYFVVNYFGKNDYLFKHRNITKKK